MQDSRRNWERSPYLRFPRLFRDGPSREWRTGTVILRVMLLVWVLFLLNHQ